MCIQTVTSAIIMLTFLLLLSVQFTVGITEEKFVRKNCLTNCTCTDGDHGPTMLEVHCLGRADVELSDQLDVLLTRNLTYSHLEVLVIVDATLAQVSRSVCRLATLKKLILRYNRLTQMPDNCFTNLTNLRVFWATENAIETLQDELFDGLTKLQNLNLNSNRISSIDSSVCQLTALRYLDLSQNKLTRLPDDCLANLTNLTGFWANNNAIETLPDGVFVRLTKLRYLYLSRNRISSIGSCFANLTNLEVLDLSDNAIDALPDEVFEGLMALELLNLSRNNISSIDSSVCQLTALRYLDLSQNKLTRLPDDCQLHLSNPKRFTAHDSAIKTLQDHGGAVKGLDNLQRLHLYNNSITSIGSFICRLAALEHLFIDFNQLTQLPGCFKYLTNLVILSASHNAITTLQDGVFDGLTKLQYLELGHNRISSIGFSVFATSSKLSSLFFIDLSDNYLTFLEPWIFDRGFIGYTARTVVIYLTYNMISKFTNNMEHAKLCRNENLFVQVFLQANKIRHFIDIFNGWQLDIKHLDRCYTFETSFIIETDYNNIPCDCVNYYFYREILKQNLRFAWATATCNLTDPLTRKSIIVSGYYLDPTLFNCEITERCPAGCICVHRPANFTLHVYCSHTNLTVLPCELPELPDNLTKYQLDFSNNRLLRRLQHRDYFVNSSILDVSNCGVNDISDWEEITKISITNLFGNKFTSLPLSFVSVNISGKLNLANNPWDCSCDNRWMSNWLNDISDRLTEEVRCVSPSRLRGKNIIQISDEEFCVDPTTEAVKRALIISLSSVGGAVVVLLSAGFITYRLRVKLFTRFPRFHPFDRDECLGEDMDYDAFLCCSSIDDDPHGMHILELIESKGYRVCYHERDFLPGELVSSNIGHGIDRSKRTVCLLSENFLRSGICMHEFETAFHQNIIEKRKKRLIVLMMLDNPNDLLANDDANTATLRQFLRKYTYINFTADDWLDRLLYALPLHGLLQSNEDPDVSLLQL